MNYENFTFNPLGLSHELLSDAYDRMLDAARLEEYDGGQPLDAKRFDDYRAAVFRALGVLDVLRVAVGPEGVPQLMQQWRLIGLAKAVPQCMADEFEPEVLDEIECLLTDVLRPLEDSDDIVTLDMVMKHFLAVTSVLTRAVLEEHGRAGVAIFAEKMRLAARTPGLHPMGKQLFERAAAANLEGVEAILLSAHPATLRKSF